MWKYEIWSETFEVQGHYGKSGLSSEDVIDLFLDRNFSDPTLEYTFDTEAEARKAFEDCKKWAYSDDHGRYAEFRVVALCAEEFNEDEEPCEIADLEYFALPIKAEVVFEGGESRDNPGQACDYMLVTLTDGTELYAEAPAVEGKDWANFDDLKAEILKQAADSGISADRLYFFGD